MPAPTAHPWWSTRRASGTATSPRPTCPRSSSATSSAASRSSGSSSARSGRGGGAARSQGSASVQEALAVLEVSEERLHVGGVLGRRGLLQIGGEVLSSGADDAEAGGEQPAVPPLREAVGREEQQPLDDPQRANVVAGLHID